MSVADYLQRWLESDARRTCGERTWENYERSVRREIAPRIGPVVLQKLKAIQVQNLMAQMDRAGASPWTRQQARMTLHRALSRAVRLGYIPQNPVTLVEPPKIPHKPIQVLTSLESRKLLEAAKEDRLFALYVLAITGGLRQGELFGLLWEDVDWDDPAVVVQRSLDRSGRFVEPKTTTSRRRVDLPEMTIAALREHRVRMDGEGHGSPILFCDTEGKPLRQSNVLRRSFQPLLERAGIRRIRFHDIRHSHASQLLALGESAKVVQERLGHAGSAITLRIYSHLLPGMQRRAATKLGELLGGAPILR